MCGKQAIDELESIILKKYYITESLLNYCGEFKGSYNKNLKISKFIVQIPDYEAIKNANWEGK
jgi:hypothetical protein